jgi:hypothetical protein
MVVGWWVRVHARQRYGRTAGARTRRREHEALARWALARTPTLYCGSVCLSGMEGMLRESPARARAVKRARACRRACAELGTCARRIRAPRPMRRCACGNHAYTHRRHTVCAPADRADSSRFSRSVHRGAPGGGCAAAASSPACMLSPPSLEGRRVSRATLLEKYFKNNPVPYLEEYFKNNLCSVT